MKSSLLLAPALLLAFLTTACIEEPEPSGGPHTSVAWCTPDDFQRPDLELVEVTADRSPAAPATGAARFDTILDGSVDDRPGACECTDDSCMVDWIADNLGCGVCVRLVCGDDGAVGGCLPCPVLVPSEQALDNVDNSPCVIAPVTPATNPPARDIQVLDSSDVEPAAPITFRPWISRQPS